MTEHNYYVLFPLWSHEGDRALVDETKEKIEDFAELVRSRRGRKAEEKILEHPDKWRNVMAKKAEKRGEGGLAEEELDERVREFARENRRSVENSKPVYNVTCSVIERPGELGIGGHLNAEAALCSLTAYGDPEWFPDEFQEYHEHARVSETSFAPFRVEL
jgi:hypothetical protein